MRKVLLPIMLIAGTAAFAGQAFAEGGCSGIVGADQDKSQKSITAQAGQTPMSAAAATKTTN